MVFRRFDGSNDGSSSARDEEVRWLREQLQESSGQLGRVRLELAALQRSVSTTVAVATNVRDDVRGGEIPPNPSQTKTGRHRIHGVHKLAAGSSANLELHLPKPSAELAANDPLARRPDEAQKKRIISTISRRAPFEGSDEATLGRVADSMVPASFGASTDVLCEGDDGDLAYWVSSGSLEVLVGGKVRATRATRAGERSRPSSPLVPPSRIFSHCTTAPAAPRPTAPHPSRLAPPLAPLPSPPPLAILQRVDTIQADALFGQTALIYDLKRDATVRATDGH
jgi:CRP-like cAMP-binding protein